MDKRPGKYILATIIFFAFACLSAKPVHPVCASSTINGEILIQSQQSPNAELEKVQQPVTTGNQVPVKKSPVPPYLSQAATILKKHITSDNVQIKASLLLPKDYLFFIYPSHHFW